VSRRFENIRVDRDLEIRLEPSEKATVKVPILCGFQADRQ
jgi:hypothetical protein